MNFRTKAYVSGSPVWDDAYHEYICSWSIRLF